MTYIVLGIATVVSLTGTYLAYDAQKDAADLADATGKYNEQLAKNKAKTDTAVAEENMRRQARANASFLAKQRAALAKSGLSMEGTPLAVLGDTTTALERDLMDISFESSQLNTSTLYGARDTGIAGQNQAVSLNNQATAGAISGIGSAVSGYASASGYAAPKTKSYATKKY